MENNIFRTSSLLFFFCAFLFSTELKAQKQSIEIPTDGTVNVYLLNGATRKFDVYDSDKRITNLKSGYYVIYNVQPGEHLFWTAENPANFLKGNFEANSTYVVALEAQDSAMAFGIVGALAAGAKMMVFNPSEYKHKKLFYQVIKHFKKTDLDGLVVENNQEMINKAMEKYQKFSTEKENKILLVTPDMKFFDADKPVKN